MRNFEVEEGGHKRKAKHTKEEQRENLNDDSTYLRRPDQFGERTVKVEAYGVVKYGCMAIAYAGVIIVFSFALKYFLGLKTKILVSFDQLEQCTTYAEIIQFQK
jgi:hypothetical protein